MGPVGVEPATAGLAGPRAKPGAGQEGGGAHGALAVCWLDNSPSHDVASERLGTVGWNVPRVVEDRSSKQKTPAARECEGSLGWTPDTSVTPSR